MSDSPSLGTRLSKANLQTLQEIVRETEVYLSAQLTSAIAADQRAYTFAGSVTAASVLLIGAAYALATQQGPNRYLVVVAVLLAAGLFVASWLAIMSARSIDFEFPGNQPEHWADDIKNGVSFEASLAELCEHYDGMACNNTKAMARNSRLFNSAVNVALGCVGVAGILFVWDMSAKLQ